MVIDSAYLISETIFSSGIDSNSKYFHISFLYFSFNFKIFILKDKSFKKKLGNDSPIGSVIYL
ncbi:MAG: hypothetical protein LRZ98_01885 [Candidatus Pacebacteria bacterium]|nr:hypothetical protein [Candidatus Paceibacterota bacterium]